MLGPPNVPDKSSGLTVLDGPYVLETPNRPGVVEELSIPESLNGLTVLGPPNNPVDSIGPTVLGALNVAGILATSRLPGALGEAIKL